MINVPMYALFLDDEGVIIFAQASNVVPEGYVEVSQEIYNEASSKCGKSKYVDGALVDLDLPPDLTLFVPLLRRQLAQGLAEDFGCYTLCWSDAEDWATSRSLPDLINDGLTIEERPRVRLFLLAADALPRTHPYILRLQEILQWDDEMFNKFWLLAAAL